MGEEKRKKKTICKWDAKIDWKGRSVETSPLFLWRPCVVPWVSSCTFLSTPLCICLQLSPFI